MREEPVIYINGRPFVLREDERPFKNMQEYTGIDVRRLEQMELRLKNDILQVGLLPTPFNVDNQGFVDSTLLSKFEHRYIPCTAATSSLVTLKHSNQCCTAAPSGGVRGGRACSSL